MPQPSRSPFGTTPTGEAVELLTLDNGVLSCQILTYGATVRALYVPGRTGQVDVVLGYDTLEEYMDQDAYLGALVGRYINRIGEGHFSLNGHDYLLALNEGENHIHGGTVGFANRVWTVDELRADCAVLTLDSPDGEEGYPGHLQVKATYQLVGSGLTLHLQAVTDQDTPCNLSNHSYFNLSGHSTGPVLEQEITLYSSHYTPTDKANIPTGDIDLVEDTPMDLRQPTAIGTHIHEPFIQLAQANGYDHNFVVDGDSNTLRPAALVHSKETGVTLAVNTTLPGVQLYTGNSLSDRAGKDGAAYGQWHAVCLETQFFPDSPNCPQFPDCILRVGQTYDHTTQYVFSVT